MTATLNIAAVSATAWAIFYFEGGNVGDTALKPPRNIRNNNPGNLRAYESGQIVDEYGYRTFTDLGRGWTALMNDIISKVVNHLLMNQTLLDLFNIYAPAEDHNDPNSYAQFVLHWLNKTFGKTYTLASTIGEIYFE